MPRGYGDNRSWGCSPPLMQRTVYLLYLSTSFLWWQAVADIIGAKSSTRLRNNSRGTWRYRAGSRHVYNTAIRRALSPWRPCGSGTADVQAAPEAWHRSGTLSRSGTPRGRTREEQRPHRFTFLVMHRPPADAIFVSQPWPRYHWMLVRSY